MTQVAKYLPVLIISIIGLSACSKETANDMPVSAAGSSKTMESTLIVYASHNAAEIVSVLETWRSETGRRYRLLTDDMAENKTRLGNPDLMPEADLYIAGSLSEIWAAAEAGAFRPVYSEILSERVPAKLRDAESRWVALSTRARIVIYNTDKVTAAEIGQVQSYASLADDIWAGRLCVSSSALSGNQSLIAFLIRQQGPHDAELIVRGWRANLAMTVFTNDGTLLGAVADGRCAAGFVDSNILAAFMDASPDASVGSRWFEEPGNTLIDISGAGVTRHATNPDSAVRLLEWMTSTLPNTLHAALKSEFPVNSESRPGARVADWSARVEQPESLVELGFLQEEAILLIERARYP